jgi:hypothetical protein
MDLAYGSSSEREEVDFTEVLLPVIAVLADQVLGNLLEGHDVGFTTSFLHGVSDDWRENRFFTCTKDLADLESASSHLLEVVGESLSILLIEGILSHSLLSWKLFLETCFLLECFSHCSTHELDSQHSKMHCS